MEDSCLQRQPSRPKVAASGISIFLLEELGDARLRCAQLKKYMDEAVELIDKSEQREHFFEVAGHLLHGIPDTLLRMDKALSAAAMAAAKLDYEETKDELRPEKVDELERALEEVRVRRVKRRSDEAENPTMKIPEAVAQMEHLAASIEATGSVDSSALANLITQLEGPSVKTASATQEIAGVLRALSASLLDTGNSEHRPSRLALASMLRRVFGDTVNLKAAAEPKVEPTTAAADAAKRSRFEEGKPADPTENMDKDDAAKWKTEHDKNKDNFKSAAMHGLDTKVREALEEAWSNGEFQRNPGGGEFDTKYLRELDQAAKRAAASSSRNGQPPRGALATLADAVVMFAYGLGMSHSTKTASEDKESRFEEGKPADPTKEMSPDDAKKWKQQTEEHKDEFKAASDEEKRSRFEEGKPADPTEEMSPEDARKWKQNTEEHKDDFKSASRWKVEASGPSTSNWRELNGIYLGDSGSKQHWVWEGDDMSFFVTQIEGPGMPLYQLRMGAIIDGQDTGRLKLRRPPQFKKQDDAFRAAAQWYRIIKDHNNNPGRAGGLDLSRDWQKDRG